MQPILMLTLLGSVSCGKYFFSPSCPNVSIKDDFDMNGLMGPWYEESYIGRGSWWFPGGRCHTIQFDWVRGSRRTQYVVHLRQLFKWFNTPIVRNASLQIDGAKLKFKFNHSLGPFTQAVFFPYWIFDTDYVNWALIWSCIEKTFRIRANVYILTRDREPLNKDAEKQLQAALLKMKLTREMFNKQSQDDCSKYETLLMNTDVNV